MAEHSQSSRLPMKPHLFFDALIPTVTASEGSQAKPFALASGRQVPKGNGFKGLWLGPSGEFPAQCLQALGQAGTLRRRLGKGGDLPLGQSQGCARFVGFTQHQIGESEAQPAVGVGRLDRKSPRMTTSPSCALSTT